MEPRVILETALHREEISAIETLMLFQDEQTELGTVQKVADTFNRRFNNNVVTFVRSKQVHYTNICRASCKFCSFYRKKNQKSAFARPIEEIVREVRAAGSIRQIVLSGGLNQDLLLPYHVELLRTLHREFPALHLHGYSPSEVHFLARRSRTSHADVLRKLQDAGLDSLSGDSADILNDKMRKKICPDKLRTADWVDIIRTAHRLGLPTTATLLFGHVEDEIYICEHLEIIKNIQKETGGFTAFEPVPFVPQGSALHREKRIKNPLTPERILKTIAISRIFFGRLIRNLQIDWTKMDHETAVAALGAGANDLGGLSVDSYEIRMPEYDRKLSLPTPTVRQLIQKAGRIPMERDPYSNRSRTPVRPRLEDSLVV